MKAIAVFNEKATVSSKGQVVIPKSLREALGIHSGMVLNFETQANGSLVVKPMMSSIDKFFGCCRDSKKPSKSPVNVDKAIMQAVADNDSRHRNKR